MSTATSIGAMAIAALITSPALAQEGQAQPTTVAGVPVQGDGDACTWVRNINGFEALDRRHLVLTAIGDERYLVRITPTGTAGPRFAFQIAVVSDDSRLCGYGFDHLVIDGERATILDMWEIGPERDQADVAGRDTEADGWALRPE